MANESDAQTTDLSSKHMVLVWALGLLHGQEHRRAYHSRYYTYKDLNNRDKLTEEAVESLLGPSEWMQEVTDIGAQS